LQYLPTGSKVLLYGPGLDVLNIENLRNAVGNGYYFASPYTASYISRASADFAEQSPNGIFTFSNAHRQVAQFNGASGSSYILTSKGYSAPNTLTITGWFISTSFQNNYQFPIDSNPEGNWRIGFNSANQIYFDPGSHNDQVISTTIKFNRWYFAAFTAQNSGSNTIWNFYLNGSLVASGSVGQNIQSVSAIGLGDYAYYFVGQLSNVQIYNTSLSASQIQQLYQEGISGLPISNAGLIGWWPLNGNANDYSGNGNNGVATSVLYAQPSNYTRDSIKITPSYVTSPLPGILSCTNNTNCANPLPKLFLSSSSLENGQEYAAQFNGQSSVIHTNLLFPSTNTVNFTVTGWIDSQLIIPHNPGGIVDADNGNNGWGLYYWQGNPGDLDFWILGQGYTQDMDFGPVYPNIWTFFSITYWYTGSAWYADGYINGKLVDGPVQRGGIVEPLPFGIEIGQIRETTSYMMNGSMTNIQIYNTSLSANEIQALYQEGIDGAPVDLQHLVAWWPLNGNANDYSGNGNNGTQYNVWYSPINGTYSAPGLSSIIGVEDEWESIGMTN